jgi:toxin YoeB
VSWRLVYTRQAQKDARKLASTGLKAKASALLDVLAEDPDRTPPPFEKLVGDLAGAYSRRINIQHRLVYQVLEDEKTVKVLRMWTYLDVLRVGRTSASLVTRGHEPVLRRR